MRSIAFLLLAIMTIDATIVTNGILSYKGHKKYLWTPNIYELTYVYMYSHGSDYYRATACHSDFKDSWIVTDKINTTLTFECHDSCCPILTNNLTDYKNKKIGESLRLTIEPKAKTFHIDQLPQTQVENQSYYFMFHVLGSLGVIGVLTTIYSISAKIQSLQAGVKPFLEQSCIKYD